MTKKSILPYSTARVFYTWFSCLRLTRAYAVAFKVIYSISPMPDHMYTAFGTCICAFARNMWCKSLFTEPTNLWQRISSGRTYVRSDNYTPAGRKRCSSYQVVPGLLHQSWTIWLFSELQCRRTMVSFICTSQLYTILVGKSCFAIFRYCSIRFFF